MNILNPSQVMRPAPGFSQGVAVGETIYVAGQVSVDADGAIVGTGDIREQTRQTIDNVAHVLAAGGMQLSDIVSATIYISDLANYAGFCEVWCAVLGTHAPARATVRADLVLPALLVEIQAVAVRAEA